MMFLFHGEVSRRTPERAHIARSYVPPLIALVTANCLAETLVGHRLLTESFALEFAIFALLWLVGYAIVNRRLPSVTRRNIPSFVVLLIAVALCNAWLHLYSFLAEAACCAAMYQIATALLAKARSS